MDIITEHFGERKNRETSHIEMAKIDLYYKDNLGLFGKDNLAIYVCGNEPSSKPPHFHIVDKQTNGKNFYLEVRIDDLSIMLITDKSKGINKLAKKDLTWDGYGEIRKKLIEFLKARFVDITGLQSATYYIFIVAEWNHNNPENKTMPNPNLLKSL